MTTLIVVDEGVSYNLLNLHSRKIVLLFANIISLISDQTNLKHSVYFQSGPYLILPHVVFIL